MTSAAELKSIDRIYQLDENRVIALNDFSYDFRKGQVIVIAGPSGSGKSTLLNLVGCIDKPTNGRVFIGGEDVTDRTLESMADIRLEKIGFIFQHFSLIPVLTVYENVELPLLCRKLEPDDVKERVIRTLERVELTDRMTHYPGQISGGQRQRVAIARALAGNPEIVVADEPTANLDSVTAMEIVKLLSDLNQIFETTILLATHDQKLINMADQVLNIEDGMLLN